MVPGIDTKSDPEVEYASDADAQSKQEESYGRKGFMAGSPLTYGSRSGLLGGNRGESFLFPASAYSLLPAMGLLVIDGICAASAAVAASYVLIPAGERSELLAYLASHTVYLAAYIVGWAFAATHQQLFTSYGKESLGYQLFGVLKATVLALIFSGFVGAFFSERGPEPRFLGYFGVSTLIVMSLWRTLVCLMAWAVHARGYRARHVLVVGANLRTRHLIDTILTHARFGYQIVGILESDASRMEVLKDYGLAYSGKFEDLERVLTERVVDEVHVCLPVRSSYEIIQSMANLCCGAGVSVRLVADLFPLKLATSRVHNLANIPMLSLTTVPEGTVQLALKRLIDIFVSLALLAVLSPMFLLFAILIKLDSRGPVFFFQERVGMNGRRFRMIKFRSMVTDAEAKRGEIEALNEADGPVFKIRQDPRVTRVGRFIRKYSVDEFPQLFNVLKGEMSLVGPRPPIASEVAQYSWDQRRRLSVKPGMTGLWQVSGRSDVSFKEWVEMDLEYIDSWSLLQDFRILFRTFSAVVNGRGAA